MKYISDFVDFRKHKTLKELKELLKECESIPRKIQLEKHGKFTGRINSEQSMLVDKCKKKIKEKIDSLTKKNRE